MSNIDVTIESPRGARAPVVSVAGDLDLAAVPRVRQALAEADEPAPEVLALDLSDVVHLDSSGLRVLLDAAGRARDRGGRLVIVAPADGPVGRLLELTLLADHLEVVRDREAVAP